MKAVLLVCEHTFNPDVFKCSEKCVYAEAAQGGMEVGVDMGIIPLNPDRTVPMQHLKGAGMVDHTSDVEDKEQKGSDAAPSQTRATAKCDICSQQITEPSGFCLSTREVVLTVNYWKDGFSRHRSQYSAVTNQTQVDSVLNATVSRQAGQSTGWLVCDKCIGLFNVDREKTRQYAKDWWAHGRKDERRGLGAVPREEAMPMVRQAWTEAMGKKWWQFWK